MKLFKRLLAAALVGVLALTLMVGCSGNPNADNNPPTEQVVVYNAWQKLLTEAPNNNKVVGGDYSRILSNVAYSMLLAVNSVNYQIGGEYSADPDAAAKAAFQKAIDDGTLPQGSELCVGYLASNPAWVGSANDYNYTALFDDPNFENANTFGIVYTRDDRIDAISGAQLMIVAARIPKTSK